MDLLQLREKELFETLKKLKDRKFVVIGGYAVNPYTMPRFSKDCDVVVKDAHEARKIIEKLLDTGYYKVITKEPDIPYYGDFERYEKKIQKNISASIDILVKEVFDRQTDTIFTAEWIFKNSKIRTLRGKTIMEKIKLRIINLDALFVMKMISARSTDIRDAFMLAPDIKDKTWIKEEVAKRYDFDNRYSKIVKTITSAQFRDGLQGVFGRIHDKVFEKHKKAILELKKQLKK